MFRYRYLTAVISVWILGWAAMAHAQQFYVSGVTKISLRSGPTLEHRILAMLESGASLKMIEHQRDWSRVETQDQKQGWVLTRYLTEEEPLNRRYDLLKKENVTLTDALHVCNEKNQELGQSHADLTDLQSRYQELKQASSDYLKLETEYTNLLKVHEEQKEFLTKMESNLKNEEIIWFLGGAGVFVLGVILGLVQRKRKRSSLL